MLADSTLPLHVVSGLHAISSLLKPAETHNAVHKPKVSPLISLTEATSYGSDTEDSPYTGERPSSLPKRLRRSLPQSLIRRMSASTWTTTTSATGMPTLEPEPCRTRSSSFRHSCDNTPSSSPVASRSNSPSPGSPTTLALNIPKTRSFSVASVGPMVITPRKPSREHRSCFGATADTSRLCPLKTDIAGSLVCARTADMLNELPTGDQASTARDAQSGLSKRLNITSDYESSSSPSSSEHSDHQSCSDDIGGRNVGVIVRSTTDIKSALQKIENIPHQKGDPHKEDRQHKFVHNNTSQSISWSTSSVTSRTGSAHRHSHNDKKVQDTIGHQVASAGDAPEVMLGADPFDIDEVDKIEMLEMRNLAEWDYPIFSLSDVVPSTILSMVAYKIFREVGFFETFRIPLPEFLHYFHTLELGYRNNPYHNRVHATDVLHGVYYFTSQAIPGLQQVNLEGDLFHKDCSDSGFDVEKCSHTSMSFVAADCTCGIMGANFPPLELMALYTAAAMHDYDHPGRTNAFLVATHAPLAVLYNDRSVLESHHAASVWRLFLTHPEYNWLVHLDKAEFKRFRFLVIEAILATDLKQHFEILAEFNAKITEEDAPGIDWTSETDRLMVANMVIKVADINGPCKKKDLHLQWTRRISEEFYEQGDEEASLGLPISPYMDRKHPQLAKLQESFINHLLAPLCNAIAAAGLVPGTWVDGELDSESGSDRDKESDQDCEGEAENDDEDNVVHLPGDSRKPECAAASKRKVHCHLMQNLKDNYDLWVKVLKQELEEKEREALKLPDDLPLRSQSIDTETGKLEMETIKEEDTPPSSVNTTREDNESSSTSPAPTDTDHQADHESTVLSINHVTSSDINNRLEMTSLPATKNESEVTSLLDSKSQLESTSPLSASRTVTLNLSRSQSDGHAPSGSQSKSRSRLARPCHKENAVKKSGV
ncbi:cGMP-inhibited 3',5'-cyclic phosphodiesterase A [Lamellibrachia satsuma]|nr:cGMP-inhibited 3',5'-cyclic phosphodiesterase A [Lamellibrachia satsuma]